MRTVKLMQNIIIPMIGILFFAKAYKMDCEYNSTLSTTICTNVRRSSDFISSSYDFNNRYMTRVNCSNCSLKSIDTNSFQISGNYIKHLVLRESGIEELQHGAFDGLIFLQILDLSNNDIRVVHRGTFEGANSTEELNLRNNSFVLISNDAFAELIYLTTLTLSESRMPLVMQTKAFNGLKKLKVLNVAKSQITNVTDVFNNLTSLQYLDLSGNSISTLQGYEFKNLTSLLELKLDKNKIKSLMPLEFFGTPNLKVLKLSDNCIEQIENKAFDGLNMLEFLDLANNKIITVPEKIFQYSHGLVNINLTKNEIDIFRINRLAGLPKLKVLNLSQNLIENIDSTGVFPLHELQSLDLSSNNLTNINYIDLIHRMPRISYLNLQYNYWRCGLQEEMNKVFGGAIFQFVLFNSKNDSVKCNENYVKEDDGKSPIDEATSHIYIYMIITLLIIAVVVLSYRQYRFSQEFHFSPLEMRRQTTTENKLSKSDIRENIYDTVRTGPAPAFSAPDV